MRSQENPPSPEVKGPDVKGPDLKGPDLSGPVLDRLKGLHPSVIDLSLGRMRRLMARLGDPQAALPPVVHVAGTNGKGSTVAILRAMLEAAGRRVHAYTSPHLVRFHERVRLGGRPIADDALAAVLEEVERANAGDPVTFFEATTAAAFLAFARDPADVVLLEVGLGGRLDATNLVDRPAATAITPVSMDHMDYLGDTLAAIAGEKAGILKPGVPCVVAPQAPEAEAVVLARAAEIGAPLLLHGRDWAVAPGEGGGFLVRDARGERRYPPPALPGPHQAVNAAVAIGCLRAAAAAAPAFALPEAAVLAGLAAARWPGRLQRVESGRLAEAAGPHELWLDAAHNPGGALALAEAIRGWGDRPLRLGFGMLSDRDPAHFLRALDFPFADAVSLPIPGEPRALPPEAVAEAARAAGVAMRPAPGIEAGVAALAAAPGAPGRILVTGSLALVAEALRLNGAPLP